jgi:hypothetical protein
MTEGNKTRMRQGKPLHYKKKNYSNQIPYAYYCKEDETYYEAATGKRAPQVKLSSFYNSWNANKRKGIYTHEEILYKSRKVVRIETE